MTKWAIEAENVGKRYRLGDGSTRRMADLFRPWRYGAQARLFWAVDDVSFKVEKGESVGIIGRNGAGKSTLLKVLSRITAPTRGRVRIDGKVGTLLEVGTGFHPELSGRENIYLSGSILGLSRSEIRRRFDEIVEFSGVAKFLDTPIKRYSSGMQVRLAFSVALYLDPEILIIDEVLAVGDMAFQRKSVSKLRSATSTDKRTVLFVSHSLQAVKRLCSRVIVMDRGHIVFDGATDDAIAQYRNFVRSESAGGKENELAVNSVLSPKAVHVAAFDVLSESGQEKSSFQTGETVLIKVEMDLLQSVPDMAFRFQLLTQHPEVGVSQDIVTEVRGTVSKEPLPTGCRCKLELRFPYIKLRSGEFWPVLHLDSADHSSEYGCFPLPRAMTIVSDAVERQGRIGLLSVEYECNATPLSDAESVNEAASIV